MLGTEHKTDSMENKPTSLFAVSLGNALNKMPLSSCGRQVVYHSSQGYNCEAAHPACCKKRLLDTHQWQFALLVVGQPGIHDWFKMGSHLCSILIQLGDGVNLDCRLCHTSILRKRRGNHNNNNMAPEQKLLVNFNCYLIMAK